MLKCCKMSEDTVPALEGEAPATEAPPAEGPLEDEIPVAALVEQPKRRPKYYTHWQRPKSQIYEYNNDFRQNYYSHVVDYIDKRRDGYKPEIPRPQSWAERALRTFSEKKNTQSKKDVELIHNIRSNINNYAYHRQLSSKKLWNYAF
ncbi:hypothetical protein QYM36_014306 [Artemia franciscana]|uniref:Flightin n=1 Tax=Artemia franciscana TaxID=6661 RepID=A0AA88KVI2_ARTSF|nr:hypothetical protein QYM36_014306 [Artemia franciscana]